MNHDDIEKKLERARERSENYGYLYGRKETADDYVKLCYADLYEEAPAGSVAERDCWVKRQDKYKNAIERKRDAYAAWKCAESYMKILLAEVDVYRTQEATNRYMDKAHQ